VYIASSALVAAIASIAVLAVACAPAQPPAPTAAPTKPTEAVKPAAQPTATPAAAAPAAPAKEKPRYSVKIGYIPVDSFAALYIAAERYLPGEGFEVETVKLPSGAEILSQTATGQLQVGGGALGAAGYNAIAEGLSIKFVAPLHSGRLEDYFAVRKAAWGSEIKGIADLKGKPLAVNARGVATEWLLDEALRRDGLTLGDVDVKTMPFPDMVTALESGAIYGGIVSEPFPTIAEQKGVGLRPLDVSAQTRPVPITMVFWNTDWAKNNPAAADRFMVAYVKAARDLALDNGWQREDNLPIIAKYSGADLAVLKAARPHYLDPNLEIDKSVLETQQEFNMQYGYLRYREPLPLEKVFDFSYVDKALQELSRK
jgi:NitT/TauT family transport system substrate-binding protein